MAIRAGRMRLRLTIEEPTEDSTRSTHGAPTYTWTYVTDVWADLMSQQATERFRDSQDLAEVTHVFVGRWQSGITPKMRVYWQSRDFRIISVINVDERDREMRIATVEEVPARG